MLYLTLTLALLSLTNLPDPEDPAYTCIRFGGEVEEYLERHYVPSPVPFNAAGRAVALCTLGTPEEPE